MNDRELDALMRQALRDQRTWDEVTATPGGVALARRWLKEALRRVKDDICQRKAEWSAYAAAHGSTSTEARRELAAYKAWKQRAHGFQSVVTDALDRINEIRLDSHLARMTRDRDAYRQVILELGKAMLKSSDRSMRATLAAITMPNGVDGEVPVGEIIAALYAASDESYKADLGLVQGAD